MADESRRPFITLCVIGLFCFFSYNLVRTPVLPLLAADLGASPELIGLIVSVSTITGIFIKLPAGVVADLIGRRKILIAAVVIFAVMPLAYVFVDRTGELLMVRSIHGLATALFAPVAMAMVAGFMPQKRGETLGWYFSSTQLGKLLGPMAGGALLGLVGFPPLFIICTLVGIIPLVLVMSLPATAPARDPAGGPEWSTARFLEDLKGVVTDLKVLVISLAEAVQMLAAGALMAFLPVYGLHVGLSFMEVGLLFGAQGGSALISKPLVGKISDRVGRRPMIIAGLFISAAAFPLIAETGQFAQLLFLAAVFGLGEAIVISSTSALVADTRKNRPLGAAMGAYGTIMDAGHALGPILAGVLIGSLGYQAAFRIIAGILIVGLILFVLAVRGGLAGRKTP